MQILWGLKSLFLLLQKKINMKIVKFIVLLIIVFAIGSCHKDIDEDTIITTSTPTAKVYDEIQNSILGYVYDEDNQPIQDARVSIYSSSTTTDKYGVFSFENVKMDKLGTYIKVEKKGYILGSDKIYPSGGLNFSYIHLYKLDKTAEFDATKGGKVQFENGGEVVFSPNSIATQNGSDYSGKVVVTAKRLDADDRKIAEKMPGALMGEDEKGNTVVLGTMGMMVVELRDEDGNKLNLKQGYTAGISLPVSAGQISSAPDEIPLWYFDENKGIWIEEGKALLEDGNFVGEVPHFSWWNIDAKFPTIYMCVKVLFENGEPATGYIVSLKADVIFSTTSGITDTNGEVCGLVPKGKRMTIKVKDLLCDKILYKKIIGPFENDVVLDDIIIPLNGIFGNGQIVCNDDPVKKARIYLKYKTTTSLGTRIFLTDDNGKFVLNYDMNNCEDITWASLLAYNPITGDASQEIDLDVGNTNNNMKINICHNCEYDVEIKPEYTNGCDPNSLTLDAVVTGTGTYIYKWSNGASSNKIDNLEAGLYCVTVTETVAQCDVIKCIMVSGSEMNFLDIEYGHPYCDFENGKLGISFEGGIEPYVFSVSGPDGYTFSSNSTERYYLLTNLKKGTYNVTVTDAAGCTKTKEMNLISGKDHRVIINAESSLNSCDSVYLIAQVEPVLDLSKQTFKWSDGQEGNKILVYQSGQYCVTVSEGTGCTIDTCIDVEVIKSVEPPHFEDCDKNIYRITNHEVYQLNIAGIFIDSDASYEFDIFKDDITNMYYYAGAFCGPVEGYMTLPNLFEGITIDSVQYVSCTGCSDGQIYYTINSGNNCNDCSVGDAYVFSVNDLNTDLTAANNAGTLDTGQYYVVVTDATSGCFIAYQKVHIYESDANCLPDDLMVGIEAFYPFSNGSLQDFSGNNHNLVAQFPGQNAPIPTTDRNGNADCAYNFLNGYEMGFLSTTDSFDLQNRDFTISLWYQALDTRVNDREGLFEIGYIDDGLFLGLTECRMAEFQWSNICIDNPDIFGCDTALTNHDWHHLAAVYDSEYDIMKLYRNGELMDMEEIGNLPFTTKNYLVMGLNYIGKIDDVIFYYRVLEQTDIKRLYNAGSCCQQ